MEMALKATIPRADQPLTFYLLGENHEELESYPLRSAFDVGCLHDRFCWNHLNDRTWNHFHHWNYLHDWDHLHHWNHLHDESRCPGGRRNSRLHPDDVDCPLVTFSQFEGGSVKLARFPFKNQSNCEKTIIKCPRTDIVATDMPQKKGLAMKKEEFLSR